VRSAFRSAVIAPQTSAFLFADAEDFPPLRQCASDAKRALPSICRIMQHDMGG
jgi:hypothetical protein